MRQGSPFSPYDLSFFDRASAVVVMVAFMDASEQGGFIGVGGYLFRKKHLRPFERRWNAMLKKYDLSCFHMTDCNAKQDEFQDKDCDEAARTAISAIKDFATEGVSAAVKIADFHDFMGPDGVMWNPFSLCAYACVAQASRWADLNDPTARIYYVFEAGDEHQADADRLLQSIADDPKRKARFHYEDHAFLTKRGSKPTQAADIIAWHVCKQFTRRERDPEIRLRGDFNELVSSIPTREFLLDRQRLAGLVDLVRENAPVDDPEKLAGLALRLNKTNEKTIGREMLRLIRGDN